MNRRILRLAVPALGALVAEPLFLLADSAIVGHLGTPSLAGLGLAAGVLSTAVGLSIFLAYGATAAVARRSGSGDARGALEHGVDGLWLAAAIGIGLAVLIGPAAPVWVGLLGGRGVVAHQAVVYLRWSTVGLPAMLLVLAATGVIRGLQRTLPPLIVAAAGAVLNVLLNLVLVYGLDLGIAGSAIGTVLAQVLMAVALTAVVAHETRLAGVSTRPVPARIARAGRAGFAVFIRTLWLRIALLATIAVGAAKGDVALATLQITFNLWNLLALALDAVAIAAQALTGHALGAGDAAAARALTRRMLLWGCTAGLVSGVALAAVSPVIGRLFSPDPAVIAAVTTTTLILAAGQLVSGWVFVLDGVLLGAGDGRYLAWSGLLNLVSYAPALVLVAVAAPIGEPGIRWLWIAYIAVYMSSRAMTLGLRYRSDSWIRAGR